MPGPWIDGKTLLANAKARLLMAQANATPESMAVLMDSAVQRGYLHLQGILGSRGYTNLDTWNGRVQYNTDYGVAFAFRYSAFAAQFDQVAIDKELELLDKSLTDMQLLFDDSGNVILPNPLYSGGANTGRMCTYDRDLKEVKEW